MPPSSPSDLFWNALAPLAQQLEAFGRVLERLATYYFWCVGCAAGLALLLLVGLALKQILEAPAERPGAPEARRPPHAGSR